MSAPPFFQGRFRADMEALSRDICSAWEAASAQTLERNDLPDGENREALELVGEFYTALAIIDATGGDPAQITLLRDEYRLRLDEYAVLAKAIRKGLDRARAEKLREALSAVFNLGIMHGSVLTEAALTTAKLDALSAEDARDKATRARRQAGDPVREAARADIAANPKTTQGACASRVAKALGKDKDQVERLIRLLFEWRDLPGGGREKRPRQTAD